ncbi:hypothetical protein DVH24_018071 [Malus domestica]|uniref:Caffeoyl-CoA O-methyltransferase n=2 Tax=Malus domestica TaxID=3750 RepID=A0A498KCY7_MALDO|nr:hypothetical protein DVH24_018071 [Malus domestica]
MYDNTLWGGTVAWLEEDVPEAKREWRQCAIELNELVSADTRVEISKVTMGDGITIWQLLGLVAFSLQMEHSVKKDGNPVNKGLLQSDELYQYILETSVYPREPEPLKELRAATASHPRAEMATAPDAGQLMAMLLKLVDAKKTIEVGVFTGYSLLLTALTIPDDGKIVAIDVNREAYEQIGLPIIKKAGVAHKIDFIESQALPVLDKLLENHENEGSFDFAFIDADKDNYWNYHERLMKLLKVGGLVVYDNTLWGGTVVMPDELTPESKKPSRPATIEFNKFLAADPRVQISHASLGDGITICRRLY